MKRYYSRDGETFTAENWQDVVNDAFHDGAAVGSIIDVYQGDSEPCKASSFMRDVTLDSMREDAYDSYGEFAVGYLDDVYQNDIDELNKLLRFVVDIWATDKNCQPTFFDIQNVCSFKVRVLADGGGKVIL